MIMELGTGCGYHATALATYLEEEGTVVSYERKQPLAELARANIGHHEQVHGIDPSIELFHDDALSPAEERGREYDAIYLTAGVDAHAQFDRSPLHTRLAPSGTLVIPESDGKMIRYEYRKGKLWIRQSLGRFEFVPLQEGTEEDIAFRP